MLRFGLRLLNLLEEKLKKKFSNDSTTDLVLKCTQISKNKFPTYPKVLPRPLALVPLGGSRGPGNLCGEKPYLSGGKAVTRVVSGLRVTHNT